MKKVIITGATGGIGAELVKVYMINNYKVFALGTNSEKLNLLRETYTNNLETYKCDMLDIKNIKTTVEQIIDYAKNVDILINNAGVTKDNLFVRMSDEDFIKVMNVNFNAHVVFCKSVLKGMMKNKWGRIVSISSDAAKIGNPGQANYVSSKGAMEAFTRTIANEVAKRGITVNCVSPGFIRTDILETIDPNTLENMKKMIPCGEIGSPNDVANAVFFLTKEESSYITGQVLHVNGGLTM